MAISLSVVPSTAGLAGASHLKQSKPDPRQNTGPIFFSRISASGSAAPADGFYCYINTENPHQSSHYPNTVASRASVSCGIQMTHIAVGSTLYYSCCKYNYVEVGYSGTVNWYDTTTGNAVAETQCPISGFFSAYGQAYLEPPAGYQPPSSNIAQWSNTTVVSC